MTSRSSPTAAPERPAGLPFSVELGGGAGRLSLAGHDTREGLSVERLAIRLPVLDPPLDLSQGARHFQHYRGRLESIQVRIAAHALQRAADEAVTAAGGPLRSAAITLDSDDLVVRGQAQAGGRSADWVLRGRLVPAGAEGADHLLLSFVDSLVFGAWPWPAVRFAAELLRLVPDGVALRRATTHATLAPLRALLSALLVTRGWKLPARGDVSATVATVVADGLRLGFGQAADGAVEAVPAARLEEAARRAHERFVADLDAKQRYARVDALLAEGALEAAAREIERAREEGGDGTFLDGRELQLLAARDDGGAAAEELAHRILGTDPTNAPALLALAAVEERRGEAVRAARVLDRLAAAWRPGPNGAELAACRLLQARLLGPVDADGAEEVLRALLAARPDDSRALLLLADKRAGRGDTREARQLCERVLAGRAPQADQRAAAYALANLHLGAGDAAEVRPYLALLEAGSQDGDAAQEVAAGLDELEGRFDDAVRRHAVRLQRALMDGHVAAARVVADRLAQLYEERLRRAGAAAQTLAVVLGEDIPASDGDIVRGARAARLFGAAGRAQEAAEMSRRVAAALREDRGREPGAAAELLARIGAEYALAQDGHDRAWEAFERALELVPDHGRALEGLEALALTADEWDALAARLKTALAHAADAARRAALGLRLALLYGRTFGFPHEAIPLLEATLDETPDNEFALRQLLAFTRQTGDWERHHAALLRGLEGARSRPDRLAWLAQLAEVAAERLGRLEEAREHLSRALDESPRDTEILRRLAHVLRVRGEHEELARVLARQAALAGRPDLREPLLIELAELQLDILHRPAAAQATLAEIPQPGPELRRLKERAARARGSSTGIRPPQASPSFPAASSAADSDRRWHAAVAAADGGDREGACELLRATVEHDPAHRPSWELLAALLDPEADAAERAAVKSALTRLERVPSVPPEASESPTAAAAAAASDTSDVIDELVEAARVALADGAPERAREAARGALDSDPDCVEAWEIQEAACRALGDAAGAALALAGRAKRAWTAADAVALTRAAAEALVAAGMPSEAVPLVRRYLRWEPLDDAVFLTVRDALVAADAPRLADELIGLRIEALERLRVEGHDDSVAVTLSLLRTELAALREELGIRTDTLVPLLEAARRDWPRNDEALERLAARYEATASWGALADVLEALVGVTEDRPARLALLKRLAEVYRGPLADPVAARETLRSALRELPPEEARALRELLDGE